MEIKYVFAIELKAQAMLSIVNQENENFFGIALVILLIEKFRKQC